MRRSPFYDQCVIYTEEVARADRTALDRMEKYAKEFYDKLRVQQDQRNIWWEPSWLYMEIGRLLEYNRSIQNDRLKAHEAALAKLETMMGVKVTGDTTPPDYSITDLIKEFSEVQDLDGKPPTLAPKGEVNAKEADNQTNHEGAKP